MTTKRQAAAPFGVVGPIGEVVRTAWKEECRRTGVPAALPLASMCDVIGDAVARKTFEFAAVHVQEALERYAEAHGVSATNTDLLRSHCANILRKLHREFQKASKP